MGWASGTNAAGREVGYLVGAVCDQDGCDEQIDRGLAYVCGDGGEDGCGDYFCAEHLAYAVGNDMRITSPQLCPTCIERFGDGDAS